MLKLGKKSSVDLLSGDEGWVIFKFSVPIILSYLLQQIYTISDAAICGQTLGVDDIAGVNDVFPILFIFLQFAVGCTAGFSVITSIAAGRGDQARVRRSFAAQLVLGGVLSLALTGVAVLTLKPLLRFIGLSEANPGVWRAAYQYSLVIFLGIFAQLYYNLICSILRSLGDSTTPLIFLLFSTVLNIGLDLLCIIVFKMGAFGAAFATVFSQAVAGIGSLFYILKHYGELRWSKEEGKLSKRHCAKLCNMGIPMGLQCSITAIGSVLLQGAVNGLGSDIVAAQTAGGKAASFLSVPLESIGTAMTTYASQNMGAHDLGRVNKGVNTALGIGCVYSVASFLILRVMDVPLISLFLESSEVEIMANARSFIFWNSLFYIPLAVLIIYRYTIQGLGYSGLAMFAGVAEMVARVMVGCWFVPLWGYFAACIANPVAWFFACFFLIPAYFAVRKRLTKELAAARVED